MKNIIQSYQKREFHVLVQETVPNLLRLKKQGEQEAFNNLLLREIPGIQKYVEDRLRIAIKKGHFPKNQYTSADFTDQLFIEIFDHIEEIKQVKEPYVWLFKKTDELLQKALFQEKEEEFLLKNIDDYSKPERDEMEEKYSVDADGDLLMIEDLDDISYRKNDYSLNDVFIEDHEQEYINKLDNELAKAEVQKHLKRVLQKLPAQIESVFELFSIYKFKIEEIAKIKKMTPKEAEKLLSRAREILRSSLREKYWPPK